MNITYRDYHEDMAKQAHVLIAGTTGSGKSVALHGFISYLLSKSNEEVNLILIDPKRIELKRYATLPHTLLYANDYKSIAHTIDIVYNMMRDRFEKLDHANATTYTGPDTYIVIDEWVDILQASKMLKRKDLLDKVQHISSLARAVKIHLVICTQRPTKDTLPPLLKDNLPCKIALRTEGATQSRYLIESGECLTLPIGQGFYYSPTTPGVWEKIDIDYMPEQIDYLVQYWTKKAKEYETSHGPIHEVNPIVSHHSEQVEIEPKPTPWQILTSYLLNELLTPMTHKTKKNAKKRKAA